MGNQVSLFVTCMVDQLFPKVGIAMADVLERLGYRVDFPEAQTCCGQPAFNSGDRATTRAFAEQVIATFEPYDYVVAPSGSCAGTVYGVTSWTTRSSLVSGSIAASSAVR